MIPLLAIFKFFAFVLSVFTTFRVHQTLKKNPADEALYCFYKFFFYLNFVFLPFLIPPLGVNLKGVQLSFYITNFFIFICMAYLLRIVLLFTYFKEFRKIIFWLVVLMAFGGIILDAIYFQPALILNYQFAGFNFVGWILNFPSWLTILYGLLVIISLGLAILLFFIKGSAEEEYYLKIRSFLFGGGILALGIAAIGYLFFGSIVLLNLTKDIIHGTASIVSLLFIIAGIYYKREEIKKIE